MAPIFRKVDCYSIPVSDMDKALDFYCSKLEHELIWRTQSAAELRLPGSEAEFVLSTENRPQETDLLVDSVPKAIEEWISAGGSVVRGPFEIQIGLCAVLQDPWSNQLVILDASEGHLKTDEAGNVI